MSNSLERRMAYGKKVDEMNKKRGTFSKFGATSGAMTSRPGTVVPPSTAEQNLYRGTVDQTALQGEDAKKKAEEQVDKEEKKDPDRSNFDHSKSGNEQRSSTQAPTTKSVILGGSHAKVWGFVSGRTIPRVTHSVINQWLPHSLGMNQVLNAMHTVLDGNERLRWIAPKYLSMAVTLYYSVLWYVQILRAQTAAKTIKKADASWLRGFFRSYSEESLIVAGPLVPIFETLVGVLLENPYNDWIVPTLPDNLAGSEAGASIQTFHDLIPNVPCVFDLLQTYCSLQVINGNNFEDGEFVKFKFANGGTIGGFTVAQAPGNTHWTYAFPGIDNSFPESQARLVEMHRAWARKTIARENGIRDNTPLKTIGQWLRMENDYLWFGDCLETAVLQSKFFSNGMNLSKIQTTGGLDVLIQNEYSARRKPDGSTGVIPQPIKWYPHSYSRLNSSFKTREAETTTMDMWNAFYAQSLSCGPRGNPKHGCEQQVRSGRYWTNQEFQFDEEHSFPINENLDTLMITQFYDADGNAGD